MEPKNRRFGLNGSTLKMIAVVTMLIDHVAAVLLVKMLILNGTWELTGYSDSRVLNILTLEHMNMVKMYQLMRDIGRIAFPIYCFLLVEGFMRTRNVKKYLGRMLLFAFISEIPFNLAFTGKIFYRDYQNVMFTLFWGLLAMYVSQIVELKADKWFVKWFLTALIWLAAAGGAEVMLTDYGAKGVLAILALYLFRRNRSWQLVAGCAAFLWEMPALFGFIPIACYNGKRGMKLKYFFYAFYPVHLVVLYLIAVVLGVGGYAAW